ncbi:hypothetical protein BO226_08535 [Rhodococcus sp. 2G]|nr:hypothetical protein BO226_08535 [Rhodococcus sp. 2G]
MVSFGAGFAAPDLTFEVVIVIFSVSRSDRPVSCAKVITGIRPPYDTMLSSSNSADSALNVWDTCTGSAFLELDWFVREEHQSSQFRGRFLYFDTPLPAGGIGGFRLIPPGPGA